MTQIKLTYNMIAMVDESDREAVSRYNWQAVRRGRKWYARARIPNPVRYVYLHRFLTSAPAGKSVDHINGDTLDNRRSNLRVCTQGQNAANMRRLNGHKGASWDKRSGRWRAYIVKDGRQRHLGYFDGMTEALLAYNRAALSTFGEFAHLNAV